MTKKDIGRRNHSTTYPERNWSHPDFEFAAAVGKPPFAAVATTEGKKQNSKQRTSTAPSPSAAPVRMRIEMEPSEHYKTFAAVNSKAARGVRRSSEAN